MRSARSGLPATNGAIMILTVLISLSASLSTTPIGAGSLQTTRIDLTLSNDRPLRGERIIVSGRLSTLADDRPIPLVVVHLEYRRLGDQNLTREVTMITSNPSGLFQDIVNTTYLLRIGTWIVNASFPSQLDYPSTSTFKTFTVVVQPSLSLYVSARSIVLGQAVTFHGLLFACIPCLSDQVTMSLTRPDGSLLILAVNLVASGGPYPGGYFESSFRPDKPGLWTIKATWKGNDVTLPARSQVEEINVEGPEASAARTTAYAAAVIFSGAGVIGVVLYQRKIRGPKGKRR